MSYRFAILIPFSILVAKILETLNNAKSLSLAVNCTRAADHFKGKTRR